jgi:pimeloyl-ACP methyl ester carboxylesterase
MPRTERAGVALEYEFTDGAGPVVVFCSGLRSDMAGTKALRLAQLCAARGQAMLRFDYAGHGRSGGNFIDGCISGWAADAAQVIAAAVPGRELILVGSSMGGWVSLLLAPQLGPRLCGLLLIAPAPDFTERLIKPAMSALEVEQIQTLGVVYQPSEYGEPMPISLKLLEDGAQHLLLDGEIAVTCPVRILHGMRDDAVPWQMSLRLAACLAAEDVRLSFVKDGDHRLSREQDLALLEHGLAGLLGA